MANLYNYFHRVLFPVVKDGSEYYVLMSVLENKVPYSHSHPFMVWVLRLSIPWGWEMVLCLRAVDAPAEDTGWVPSTHSTHMALHIDSVTPIPANPSPVHACTWYTNMRAGKHSCTESKKNEIFLKDSHLLERI